MPAADVLVVVDAGDSQVEIRNKATLAVVLAVGSHGSGNAQLDDPTHIALDENLVHIQDTANSRVIQWHWSDLSYYGKVTWATLELANAANCLTVNRTQMLLGRAATNRETDLFLFTAPHDSQGQYGTGQAGVIVGVQVDNDYVYVADSAGNKVLRYTIGSDVAPDEFVAVPAGYTVAGLTMDATSLYVPCNHATNDAKVLIINKTTMALTTSGDLLNKKAVYAVAIDLTKLYFTDTADHSINWILKNLSGAITAATDLTDPRGVAVLSPIYDDLYNGPRAFVGNATGGGIAAGSATLYPSLASAAAVGGGIAAGSINPAMAAVSATGGGIAVGSITVQLATSGAATGGGVVTAELLSMPSVSATGGGVAEGGFVTSGPAEMLSVSDDSGDSVAILTDVEAE
jgi:hypothetical protein